MIVRPSLPIADFLRNHYRNAAAQSAETQAARAAFLSWQPSPDGIPAQRSEHRLVQGSKNPTRIFDSQARLVIEHREWADEYRIRLKTEVSVGQAPPPQSGPRITHTLSERGARALWDCCDYVATQHGGFTTFLTLTLDPEARDRVTRERWTDAKRPGVAGDNVHADMEQDGVPPIIAAGEFSRITWGTETTVQRELSRFWDAIIKMRARGWVATRQDGSTEEVPGDESPLLYCWVAENPLNAAGERNPHIHVMMRWGVPRRLFDDWAKRLERLWGHGFAHLERIKKGKAAGYYMAKAAGYLTKALERTDTDTGEIINCDQGPIRGNRYGISAAARAPGWYELTEESRLQWDLMGHLIKRAKAAFDAKSRALREQQATAAEAMAKAEKGTPARRALARQCFTARDKRRRLRCRVGRWSVVARGRDALDEFLAWAERRGWQRHAAAPQPHWAAMYAGRAGRCRERSTDAERAAQQEAARLARGAGLSAEEFERAILTDRLRMADYVEWAEIHAGKSGVINGDLGSL